MTGSSVAGGAVVPVRAARLERTDPPAPIRILHMGLGAFHRAHQAWYTAGATDAAQWGIAAFTGRRAAAADLLRPQGGAYTVIVRSAESDRFETVQSIVQVHPGDDIDRFAELLAHDEVAVVTLTVTEAAYRLTPDGTLDLDDPDIRHDLNWVAGRDRTSPLRTPIGRLVFALAARAREGRRPVAIVPCDNMPANGRAVHGAVSDFARTLGGSWPAWIDVAACFVDTMVDRITPRTTADDIDAVIDATGRFDAAPVVTEPFSDWVLAGEFPGGRPRWDERGARFVDDIEPWERRKLWMLNGAHTLLAAIGPARGFRTVDEAMRDPECRARVESLWDDAERHLPDWLDLAQYRADLTRRFLNPRIAHLLAQIAQDAPTKLRLRIVPVAEAELVLDRVPCAAAAAVAGALLATSDEFDEGRLARLVPSLAESEPFISAARTEFRRLRSQIRRHTTVEAGGSPPRRQGARSAEERTQP